MINASFSGAEALNQRLQSLSEAKFFDALLADVAQGVFDEIEKAMAPHSKTGMLEKSLGSGAEKIGDREYRISSSGQTAPYNIFVNFGSRPHRIYPKDRKSLRWVGGNSFVFAKFVNHPGYAGDPFMVTGTQNVMQNFDSIVKKHLENI